MAKIVAQYCEVCGVAFKRRKGQVRRRYCSRECRGVASRGAGNPNWKGGVISRSDGREMVYAPDHPGANLYGGTHILSYRLIAEQLVGRPLLASEVVHHIDGDCTNNALDNLKVMRQSEHARILAPGRRDAVTGRYK